MYKYINHKYDIKRKLLLILAVVATSFVFSQNRFELELENYLSDYKNFDFEKLINSNFKTFNVNPVQWHTQSKLNVSRILDFNIKEEIYTIVISYTDSTSYLRFAQYKLHLLKDTSEIIGLVYFEEFSKQNTVNSYFNEDKINKFILKHNALYETNKNKSTFIREIIIDEEYGYCLSDHVVDNRDKISKVKDKFGKEYNIDTFRNFIRSFNVELQTYGVDGLETIYNGFYPDIIPEQKRKKSQDIKIINHIKERNSVIKTCKGRNRSVF